MDELKIFENPEFGQVRTITIDDEPWFCGKNVATALGYENTKDALKQHCKDLWVAFHDLGGYRREQKQTEVRQFSK